ncbi:hypothetical protein SARC_11101 [Sphaeroforma arctica JP610]|uniref:Uncharacterized protein n=1 Tax=Sphaeroforma arctica JP610 TaxID=667725 RepID=A0A0L0FI06_9EUKA|nr:hypothetical protein SARC_11101 [Sphaeroforma arctica JP610]KNC76395.1 hypothetical protein SARC_11101 [Sphaeroforma arctica JP610]|eukprot:XP_014150297.1 hypothetical protein SARC_11101 [Sphaeroforma arctica JP610]
MGYGYGYLAPLQATTCTTTNGSREASFKIDMENDTDWRTSCRIIKHVGYRASTHFAGSTGGTKGRIRGMGKNISLSTKKFGSRWDSMASIAELSDADIPPTRGVNHFRAIAVGRGTDNLDVGVQLE